MSCTVVALPYALMWVVGAIATAAASTAVENKNEDFFDFEDNNINENCTEDKVITEKHFIEKNFETPFMDKVLLMKTLEEHGVRNIFEWESGISGEVENYKLTFEKPSADKPYNVRISCLEHNNAEEKLNDLNGEYALNVQEDAYLHILDKLKENNMQIEQEEVMDDNTIVLTVNID
jgi:hypothetical protein